MTLEEKQFNLNQKLKNLNIGKKIILYLSLICIAGLIIRFYYVPYGLPITLDGFGGYFLYALDISILKDFPNYSPSQSGWGEFLSLFFMNFHSDNLIDYMNLQRTISVILSGVTVIPIYFICKKFFGSNYSLLGALIFAFDPRIIINSTLGISEPLYILAITLGILFFLNSNKKIIYSSFGFFAWATIIRPEGQFWFVAFSVIYFLRFRKNRKDLVSYFVCLVIFLLVLSPIVMHRIECCQEDGIIGRILVELSNYSNNPSVSNDNTNVVSYGPNFFNGIKLFGWSLIPIFIIFVPFGLIEIFKNFKFPNYILVIVTSILAVPIMYSVSIAPDTRYVFVLFPIFCVISLFGIKWISNHFNNKRIILGIITIAIISSSIIFLDIKKIDFSEDEEAYQIAQLIIDDIQGVNEGSHVIRYLQIVEMENKWPIKETTGEYIKEYSVKTISMNDYNSLNELISSQKSNLTHLIVDQDKNNPKYILEILNDEGKYPFLIKEFDSNEHGFNFVTKMYKIDYNIFKKYKIK
jgi:hypothetical protein